VESYGDAADDPAIWVHPEDPRLSLVLGTQKQMGLHVYDLEGRSLQTLPDGRLNNVDVRDGFVLGGQPVSVVAASNRTYDSLTFYRVDAQARRLINISDGIVPTGMTDPYGLCLYRNPSSGATYAFVNDSGTGRVVQFRILESSPGRVSAEPVREFVMDSQSEGCVADDETGILYIAEEDFGVYRYAAEPDGGDRRSLLDSIENGRLAADVEGVALWAGTDGRGYLVVSSQGTDNFVVYRREGGNEYVGTFHIVADADGGIDGVSETDGLEVTSAALGPAYPGGLLVAQDGRNIAPAQRQNFKFVSWADIARVLELD
jgi:3-phytase